MIAGKEDLSTWREHPVTRALKAAMTVRIGTFLRALPQYIVKDEQAKARSAAGALSAYDELFAELFVDEMDKAVMEAQDEYRDPAARNKEP